MWRLQGQWKPKKLAELLPEQKTNVERGKPVNWEKLPPHVPDRVVVFLGQTDGFPYRIESRRRQPSERAAQDGPEGRAIVTIKLHHVRFNPAIHPTFFLFSPGDLEIADGTGQFLDNLSLAP